MADFIFDNVEVMIGLFVFALLVISLTVFIVIDNKEHEMIRNSGYEIIECRKINKHIITDDEKVYIKKGEKIIETKYLIKRN